MRMSTISTTRMIISSIIMNFREETSMGMRMVFYAPHVATRFVNMVLSFDLFPCDLKYFYQSFSERHAFTGIFILTIQRHKISLRQCHIIILFVVNWKKVLELGTGRQTNSQLVLIKRKFHCPINSRF